MTESQAGDDVKQALAILRSVNRVVGLSPKPLADGMFKVDLPNGSAVLLVLLAGVVQWASVLEKDV